MRYPNNWPFPDHWEGRVATDYAEIRPYLRKKVRSFLDIGCGSGLLAVNIARDKQTKLIALLDGDGSEKKKMGFVPDLKAWNNVDVAAELVRMNVPDVAIIALHQGDKLPQVELVVSTISWGFHYPVDIYLDDVVKIGCPFVLDLRRPRYNDYEVPGYRRIVIVERDKYKRVIFQPQGNERRA